MVKVFGGDSQNVRGRSEWCSRLGCLLVSAQCDERSSGRSGFLLVVLYVDHKKVSPGFQLFLPFLSFIPKSILSLIYLICGLVLPLHTIRSLESDSRKVTEPQESDSLVVL